MGRVVFDPAPCIQLVDNGAVKLTFISPWNSVDSEAALKRHLTSLFKRLTVKELTDETGDSS